MKTRKPISVALSLLMAAGILAVPFSAEAATTNTITVTSNVADNVTATYDSNSTQLTVTFKLKADMPIVNTQGYLTYDSSVLSLAETAKSQIVPTLKDNAVVNTSASNKVNYNATNQEFFDFSSKKTYAKFVFDIVGSGNTTVNLKVECLTASSKTDPSTATTDDDVDLVYFDDVASSGFTFYPTATVTQGSSSNTTKLYMAAPTGGIGAWDGAELYYNSEGSMTGATVLPMTDTGETIVVNAAGLKTVCPGNWKLYSINLTSAQATAINNAALVGFKNANGDGRTGQKTNTSVTKAPNTTRTKYNTTAASVASLADKIFIIDGTYYSAAEVSSYKGYWATAGETYTARTMYMYAPTGSKGAWSGVELFYGDSYSTAKTIRMSKGNGTRYCDKKSLTTVESGNWNVYYKTLTLAQVMEIDAAKVVGFRNSGGTGRTSASATYDISRAPTSASGSYGKKTSISRRGGWRFIITGCSNSSSEASSYTGFWYKP